MGNNLIRSYAQTNDVASTQVGEITLPQYDVLSSILDLKKKEDKNSISFAFTKDTNRKFHTLVQSVNYVEGNTSRNEPASLSIQKKFYKTNSCQTVFGRDIKGNYIGRFSGIYTFTTLDLLQVIGQSQYVFQDRYIGSTIEEAVLGESTGEKLLDYKHSFYEYKRLDKEFLIYINNVAYNPNEFGNFIWGFICDLAGIFISPNLLARLGSLGFKDDEWEQRAITDGRRYSYTVKRRPEDEYIILGFRKYFRQHYEN